MKLFVYHVGPIDDWEGWTPVQQLVPEDGTKWTEWIYRDDAVRRWAQAMQLARQIGWEGDVRGGFFGPDGPWVCPLPCGDCQNDYLIAWKQDNNGSTFIASPVALPWLRASPDYGWPNSAVG
jgi:hypothetical protein